MEHSSGSCCLEWCGCLAVWQFLVSMTSSLFIPMPQVGFSHGAAKSGKTIGPYSPSWVWTFKLYLKWYDLLSPPPEDQNFWTEVWSLVRSPAKSFAAETAQLWFSTGSTSHPSSFQVPQHWKILIFFGDVQQIYESADQSADSLNRYEQDKNGGRYWGNQSELHKTYWQSLEKKEDREYHQFSHVTYFLSPRSRLKSGKPSSM